MNAQEKLVVEAKITHQYRNKFLEFTISHEDAIGKLYTEVYTEDNQTGDQRPLNETHAKNLAKAILDGASCSTILGGIDPSIVTIIEDKNDSKKATIVFPYKEGRFIRQADVQHGVRAVVMVKDRIPEWDWSFKCRILEGSEEEKSQIMQMLHVNANMFGRKPDKAVGACIQYRNNKLVGGEKIAGKIFERLAEDKTSAICNVIHRYHDESTKDRVGFNDFTKRSAKAFELDAISKMTEDELYEIVAAYYQRWAEHPETSKCWNDTDAYMLRQKIGLKVVTSLLYTILERTDRYETVVDANKVIARLNKGLDKIKPSVFLARGKSDRHSYRSEGALFKALEPKWKRRKNGRKN
jgi:hypothetical protein|tara:strand:+ start:1464 stop:2522 length:1059 start_codon:yes stop_codon:yes gene_type:complete